MERCFYHADRALTLQEGMVIPQSANGISRFGAAYVSQIALPLSDEHSAAHRREILAEKYRRDHPKFSMQRLSRFSAFFAALTVEEAIAHGRDLDRHRDLRIWEVWAESFVTLDRNWLDYEGEKQINFESYWYGEISNHSPAHGPRVPPRLEVLLFPPIRVGKLVRSLEAEGGPTNS